MSNPSAMMMFQMMGNQAGRNNSHLQNLDATLDHQFEEELGRISRVPQKPKPPIRQVKPPKPSPVSITNPTPPQISAKPQNPPIAVRNNPSNNLAGNIDKADGTMKLTEKEMEEILKQKEEQIVANMRGEIIREIQVKKENEALQEKKMNARVDVLVKKFKGYVWKLALPGLLYTGLDREARKRRLKSLEDLNENYPLVIESLRNSCSKIALKGLHDVRIFN